MSDRERPIVAGVNGLLMARLARYGRRMDRGGQPSSFGSSGISLTLSATWLTTYEAITFQRTTTP